VVKIPEKCKKSLAKFKPPLAKFKPPLAKWKNHFAVDLSLTEVRIIRILFGLQFPCNLLRYSNIEIIFIQVFEYLN